MFGLSSLYTSLIGGAALLMFGFGSGFYLEHRLDAATIIQMKLDDANAQTAAVQAALVLKGKQDAETVAADLANAKAQVQIQTVTRTIIREVPKYVTVKADADCVLPFGFIRLLDAAGLGIQDPAQLPNGTAEPLSANSGLHLSDISTLLIQNLSDANTLRARLVNADQAWKDQSKTALNPK